ncbi:TPA: hypothetical protein ACXDAY_003740 [Clostridium botulinum]|uniref:hypothetical protein n=1 Tax=Clostridium botulinum TaxID=1491 RepID=UPI00035BAB3B|nr:hypothetical protein [Clostridium botulinum]AUN11483.1 hypothetical protein RSJ6_13635 [Clostridium botulinum]EPS56437.1 hypothetical protein CLQ_01926 [Clostridium botulinum Af84]MBN3351652.1 hypothetical protein [Clostridium botulinum]MBN3358930.1 hypothetical protein [Clostridium botulinum]NFM82338.1 hypothetical protein [Clostridium botulinum]
MFKKILEERGINLTKAEFAIICEITTDNIKFNRLNFNKCTSLDYALDIAARSACIFKRCA